MTFTLKRNKQGGEVIHCAYFKLNQSLKSTILWDITLSGSSETSVSVNRPHGFISEKIELFIPTAVRTSNPT